MGKTLILIKIIEKYNDLKIADIMDKIDEIKQGMDLCKCRDPKLIQIEYMNGAVWMDFCENCQKFRV